MKSIPRRRFLEQAGEAAAIGCVGANFASAAAAVVLVADPADPLVAQQPVQWAIGELRQAVQDKGVSCIVPAAVPAASNFSFAVAVAASDARGFAFALTELADRVRHGDDPVAALTLRAPEAARPANTMRSIARAFVSETEDKPWFYERDFWRDYLTALVTNRFNRHLGSHGGTGAHRLRGGPNLRRGACAPRSENRPGHALLAGLRAAAASRQPGAAGARPAGRRYRHAALSPPRSGRTLVIPVEYTQSPYPRVRQPAVFRADQGLVR